MRRPPCFDPGCVPCLECRRSRQVGPTALMGRQISLAACLCHTWLMQQLILPRGVNAPRFGIPVGRTHYQARAQVLTEAGEPVYSLLRGIRLRGINSRESLIR